MSWLHHGGGYQLFCNRDEKLSRARASAPETRKRDGVRFLAPIDQAAGGTWIGTNEFGVSLCLLNGSPKGGNCSERQYNSRGLLLPELLTASSLVEAAERVWNLDLSTFAPFTLAVLETGHPTAVIEWNGQGKAVLPYGEPYMPLASSSLDPEGAQTKRRDEFHRRLNSAGDLSSDLLVAFHMSHGSEPNAYSPCMHRSGAETVSFSWVKVTDSEVEFSYTAGAPCRANSVITRTLARTQ